MCHDIFVRAVYKYNTKEVEVSMNFFFSKKNVFWEL